MSRALYVSGVDASDVPGSPCTSTLSGAPLFFAPACGKKTFFTLVNTLEIPVRYATTSTISDLLKHAWRWRSGSSCVASVW